MLWLNELEITSCYKNLHKSHSFDVKTMFQWEDFSNCLYSILKQKRRISWGPVFCVWLPTQWHTHTHTHTHTHWSGRSGLLTSVSLHFPLSIQCCLTVTVQSRVKQLFLAHHPFLKSTNYYNSKDKCFFWYSLQRSCQKHSILYS